MDKQVINMRYPVELLKRIDKFKKEKGFTTRTQAIIYLIQYALDMSDNRKG
ncbi:ribbon-helix-helix domain-containing protein [Geobacillus sp. C56-T2]|uniref:ribbon-helix-helix domain-containing protein n=1 Tax=Geobacillus sp. C56-T2 TaxID=600773 RepID=UPI00155E4CD5|nr:ribbon-helix-helix domain-containing protein [Geobacillus sp. C56-T2]